MLNRLPPGWRPHHQPVARVTSMNGVTVERSSRSSSRDADVVLFGSGIYTRAIAENAALMDRLVLDPTRQLIGAQCSGTLLLARLGLLGDAPACTDLTTKPWVIEAGVECSTALRRPAATSPPPAAAWPRSTWPPG